MDSYASPPNSQSDSRRGPGWVLGVAALVVVVAAVAGVVGYRIASEDQPGADSVDVGFLQDMTLHHRQAVAMAWVALRNDAGPAVRHTAFEILEVQQSEIGEMAAVLRGFDQPPDPLRDTVMEWMGPPFPAAQMPGLATGDELTELGLARGSALDEMFLALMIDHHYGGIEMAGYAATEASDPVVRELAARMDRDQTFEIDQMQRLLANT